jgi:hypothetical protein
VIDVAELGAYRLIIAASTSSEAVESSTRTLQAILDHESRRGSTLLPTLRTYFALGMGVSATAKAMHIHVHTVQYRLAKVENLTGLNLRTSAERLTLELSLRVTTWLAAGVTRASRRERRRAGTTLSMHRMRNQDDFGRIRTMSGFRQALWGAPRPAENHAVSFCSGSCQLRLDLR